MKKQTSSTKKTAATSRETPVASAKSKAKPGKGEEKAKKTYREMVRRMWGDTDYRQKVNDKVKKARDTPTSSAGREAKKFLKSELAITDDELIELDLSREDVELNKKKILCSNNTTFVLLAFGAQLE